jgi:hypothetical protein
MTHLVPEELYQGSFHTTLMSHRTKVDMKIRDDYEVNASFTRQGSTYEFVMKEWSMTGTDVPRALDNFHQFAFLVDHRMRGSNTASAPRLRSRLRSLPPRAREAIDFRGVRPFGSMQLSHPFQIQSPRRELLARGLRQRGTGLRRRASS